MSTQILIPKMRSLLFPVILFAGLGLAACHTPPSPMHNIGGEIPRDGRGNPIFSGIRPAPVYPAATVPLPTSAAALPPPAKPVSCRHLRRC
jgi:hypothetical protein